jgi:uncharacterized protein (TIGR02145 family)
MKKIIYFFSITFLILQSCSNNDNSDNNSNNNNEESAIVTDIDGNTYQLVTICNKTWTKSNLNVSRYRNGDNIPQVTNGSQWATLTTGAWCYYANTTPNGTIYGKLYNWYAVNDPRGLAPSGYHIPTEAEWTSLATCLGGEAIAGGKMKSTGTTLWQSPNTGATNSSGFMGLPAGAHTNFAPLYFEDINDGTSFWSSTQESTTDAWSRSLYYTETSLINETYWKHFGLSVRCIKD